MGKLANSPMQTVVRAEMAAVAVTRSRLMLLTQSMYSSLLSQTGSSAVGVQTHVPPVWLTMEACSNQIHPARVELKLTLTAMM
jgi:hypothetical protein